jgi:hypothetical protein
MAMRAKQLKAIGLEANEHGQVKADNSLLQQFVGLAEESGLCCSICREGYKFQPNKVKYSNTVFFYQSGNRVRSYDRHVNKDPKYGHQNTGNNLCPVFKWQWQLSCF